jgi:hypothetical protein
MSPSQASQPNDDGVVVCVLPDGGWKYLAGF